MRNADPVAAGPGLPASRWPGLVAGLGLVGLADDQVPFQGVVGFVHGGGLDRDHQGDRGGHGDVGQHQVDQGVGAALFQGAGRVVAGHLVGQLVDRRPAGGGVRRGQRGHPGGQAGHLGGVGVHEPVQAFLGGLEPQRVGVDPGQDPPHPAGDRPGGLGQHGGVDQRLHRRAGAVRWPRTAGWR